MSAITEIIIDLVAEEFGISRIDLISRRRAKANILPRHVGMWVCRNVTKASLITIAKAFNKKDHAVVFYAIRKINGLLRKDDELYRRVLKIVGKIPE